MRQSLYPTSFTDEQWAIIEPLPPCSKTKGRTGRPREFRYRDLIKGIFYVLRTGCTWDMMPNDLPPCSTSRLSRLRKRGLKEQGAIDYDAGKRIKGRKQHILVDTNGLLLKVVVHSAGIQDRDGTKLLFQRCKE